MTVTCLTSSSRKYSPAGVSGLGSYYIVTLPVLQSAQPCGLVSEQLQFAQLGRSESEQVKLTFESQAGYYV